MAAVCVTDTLLRVISKLKAELSLYRDSGNELPCENINSDSRYTRDENEELWEKLSQLNQLSSELSDENNAQKSVINELNNEVRCLNEKLIKKKTGSKKYKEKIKELKKEKNLFKAEILKIKQMYSDKCDKYKDIKSRLQKLLKEKSDEIVYLKDKLKENNYNIERSSSCMNKKYNKDNTASFKVENKLTYNYDRDTKVCLL